MRTSDVANWEYQLISKLRLSWPINLASRNGMFLNILTDLTLAIGNGGRYML